MKSKSQLKHTLCTGLILFLCILVNCSGRQLAVKYNLPGWLDTYGTFAAAYIFGPIPAAIIGAASNIVYSLWRINALPYCFVSVFISVSVGLFARKRYFDTLFQTMTAAGTVTIGTCVVAFILNLIFMDGSTGNIWGDGVIGYMTEVGVPRIIAAFIAEFYLEFPDKLLTSLALYGALRLTRKYRQTHCKPDEPEKKADPAKAAAAAAAILLLGMTVLPAVPMNVQAADEPAPVTYIQTIYNGENGLPCGHANVVAQTPDGILWIGTYAGLFRYNGTEFQHMNQLDAVRNVNCLYVDTEGRLWIGTNDNGVVIVIQDAVTNILNTRNGLPSDSIRSITQSTDGDYYIGTSAGAATVELKMGLTLKNEIPEVGYVGRMSANDKGYVAAVNNKGQLFLLRDGRVQTELTAGKENGSLSCCNFGEDGVLYAGSNNGLVIEYDITDGNIRKLRQSKCGDITKINNIYPDQGDSVWLCADNGIGCLNSSRKFTRQESNDFDHSVENMVEDYQGNLWFASSRLGLLRLSVSPVAHVFADTGLAPCVVNTTALYRGLLYAGSDDGLRIINLEKHTSIENAITEHLEGARIRCLFPDSDDKLWICTYGTGLVSCDQSGRIKDISEENPDIGNRVRVCTELHDGTIAAGSSTGLYFLRDGKVTQSFPLGEEFGYSQVLCMNEADDGTLYAGTDGDGITVISGGKVIKHLTRNDGLTSEVILRMVTDPADGSIYIVTSNSICRMADGKIQELRAFPYSNNYDVILDDDGEIMVPGSAGVYVMDKQSLLNGRADEYTLLDSRSGLVGALTANAWNAVDENKNLFLSADRGIFMVNLDGYLMRQRSYRLKVNTVRIDDHEAAAERGSELIVSRDTAKIEFYPEVINYTVENPVVSYYLEGFETAWHNIPQDELLSVAYTNLKPGDYVFHLAIRDDNGEILEQSDYPFVKQKAIYDNRWFKFYLIGVAGVFIGWLTWFMTRTRMQRTLQIQQAKLALALQQVQMGNETILAIAKTVDAKDVRTSKHSQRVSDYSAMIAAEYGFTEEECENLRKAALLHDIGKIAIPDSVLNKPARLTDEEYAVMKTHVTRGAAILKDFTLIDHVVEGARYHHERFDGRGYPDGLKGEEIPLYGRIIAIADAFDAMTANRVYRKRQDFDYVMGELHKGRGTQFDPDLLDIFLKLIDEKKIDIDVLYSSSPEQPKEESK